MNKKLSLAPRALIAAVVVILSLAPLAQTLRTQQPWNCFQRTVDESVFMQAIYSWHQGTGFQIPSQGKPFEPNITVGIPMAWGTALVQRISHMDWGQAARLWVYLNTALLLLLIIAAVYRRTRSLAAGMFSIAALGICLGHLPAAGYILYGVLGEIPAMVFGFLALLALDRRRPAVAGILAVVAFACKPTFLFLLPAVCIASLLIYGRRAAIKTLLVSGAGLLLFWSRIASARGESLLEYLRIFRAISSAISLPNQQQSILNYFKFAGEVTTTIVALILILGFSGLILHFEGKSRKSSKARGKISDEFSALPVITAGEAGAWFFLTIAILFYLVKGASPVPKQFTVFYIPAAIFLCMRLGAAASRLMARLNLEDSVSLAFVAATLTWVLMVPGFLRREFARSPMDTCPVKEQDYIGDYFVELSKTGNLKQTDVAEVAELSHTYFLYKLPWPITQAGKWSEMGTRPKYVAGDIKTILPAPPECPVLWKGSMMALVNCK